MERGCRGLSDSLITINNSKPRAQTQSRAFHVESGSTVESLTISDFKIEQFETNTVPTVFEFPGNVNDLNISGCFINHADNVFDFTGNISGQVSDVRAGRNVTTVYQNLGSVDFGPNVPPLVSGSLTMSTGSTGVKSTT